jgi:hypothetical protein
VRLHDVLAQPSAIRVVSRQAVQALEGGAHGGGVGVRRQDVRLGDEALERCPVEAVVRGTRPVAIRLSDRCRLGFCVGGPPP